jgi:alpha-glucoside transport system substrate-binding protein
MTFSLRRLVVPAAVLVLVGAVLTGCSSSAPTGPGNVGTADGIVKVEGPLVGHDAALLEQSWAGWEKANHIQIQYTGSANFEEQIGSEAQQGNTPDLAIFEQPGLVRDLATRGYLQKLPSSVSSSVAANFPAQWANFVKFNGSQYAAPLLATVNGWVYYSPKQFAAWGVTPPQTWDQLLALTKTIAAEHPEVSPWCEGFNADATSGAAGTNWIEDLVLRRAGPTVYDEWVSHKIPFNDPRIAKAFSDVGDILLNPDYINVNVDHQLGGVGGVASVDSDSQADVAKSLEAGTCAMTHQSSSFISDLTQTKGVAAEISPTGDFWSFILPSFQTNDLNITVGGDFVAAFSNDADTVKVQKYLTTKQWAKSRVGFGGAVSPNIYSSRSDAPLLIDRQSYNVLDDTLTLYRFDASDLMPSVVGSGAFLTGMESWITGTQTSRVLSGIDAAWPKS